MNNFIVGQVTPDMITHLRYGTFILFGLLITIGAGFIWFFGKAQKQMLYIVHSLTLNTVPETKQLTLEEMDILFGSSGVAAADQERMSQINREIGLNRRLEGSVRESDEVAEVSEKTVEPKQV